MAKRADVISLDERRKARALSPEEELALLRALAQSPQARAKLEEMLAAEREKGS